jgi:glycosyltransferase involved in cell wall biosynthesis
MTPTWDILIPTIPHRHDRLCELLAELDRQWQPGLTVRVLRDNLERANRASHGKRQDLVQAARGEYVCFIDDDDWVAPDYIARIMTALGEHPDYVGFQVLFTEDGQQHYLDDHSLRHGRFGQDGNRLLRDISHINPMLRELALLVEWSDQTDEEWVDAVRATGRVKTEVYISAEMYHYRRSSSDGWLTSRAPMTPPLPAVPIYPWLEVIGA